MEEVTYGHKAMNWENREGSAVNSGSECTLTGETGLAHFRPGNTQPLGSFKNHRGQQKNKT